MVENAIDWATRELRGIYNPRKKKMQCGRKVYLRKTKGGIRKIMGEFDANNEAGLSFKKTHLIA